MSKSKVFFIIAILFFTLIGCSQNKDGIFIEGNITEIDEEIGDIEVKGRMTISETVSSTDSFEIEKESMSQTIRVSNPEDYKVGQKVKVNVIKNYDEDIWDLDRLKFEVEEVN
ncbi:hypothetical protein ACFSTA_05330 [Ornithinibacillus salinisoli]|uniref:DUF3221 domain-containing protein n=1 Tax=Ornithinibacillus salinisoli TaxID=1848459 RepID=A0ABW4W076_9BACI